MFQMKRVLLWEVVMIKKSPCHSILSHHTLTNRTPLHGRPILVMACMITDGIRLHFIPIIIIY